MEQSISLSRDILDIKRKAEQGDPEAQFQLGWCYAVGNCLEQNWKEAVRWYSNAAEQEHPYAQFNLGVCYERGKGVPENWEKAYQLYSKSAELGCPDAQCNLGWFFKNGVGVERNWEIAVEWFKKAAEQGCAEAQFFLAECYGYGEGVEQDNNEAFNWYRKAAEQGNADAQFEIGQYYRHGFVVDQNDYIAFYWFELAAQKGNVSAQALVGYYYQKGLCVVQDYEKAMFWYQKALRGGNLQAQGYLNELEEIIRRSKEGTSSKSPYYLFFDTETTGVPMDYNAPVSNIQNWPRLVQLAWILTDEDGRELSLGNEIVKVNFVIPFDAVKVHGISTEKAQQEGKPLQSVIEAFQRDAKQASFFVGHNISFDQKVVGAELYRLGLDDTVSGKKSFCTMKEGTNFCRIPGKNGFKYPKLQELYNKLFGCSFKHAHNAMSDIIATKECFFEMKRRGLI